MSALLARDRDLQNPQFDGSWDVAPEGEFVARHGSLSASERWAKIKVSELTRGFPNCFERIM